MLAAILPFISGCSDYLDKRPDDQLDIESAFENSKNLDRWLAYIYDGIPQFYGDSNWDMIGKDCTTPAEWISVGNNVCNYQVGNWTPTNGQIIQYWSNLPKRIRSAYIFIEKAHPLTDVSQKEEPTVTAPEPAAEPEPEPQPEPEPEPEPEPVVPTADAARAYIGQSASSLIAALGSPISSSYAPSCLGPGEDGELTYSGFTVYTYRENGVETVEDVL